MSWLSLAELAKPSVVSKPEHTTAPARSGHVVSRLGCQFRGDR